jgi:anti-anti-sigma regulatory factor
MNAAAPFSGAATGARGGQSYVPGFQLTVDSIAGVLLLTVVGTLDPAACRQLDECLQQAARGRRAVVVDLAAAENMPRRAVDALVSARARLGVRLRLVVPRGRPPHAALRSAGVLHTLAVHSSGPAALTAARSGGAGSASVPQDR